MPNSAMIGDQLKALAGTVANKYDPLWFRRALNVVSEIPSWATVGQYVRVDVSSDMKMATPYDTEFPLASHKRAERTFTVIEFMNAYEIYRKEIERALQDPSYQLNSTLAVANQRRAEHTAHTVSISGKFKGAAMPTGFEGILNVTDSVDATSLISDATAWVNASSAVVGTIAQIMTFFDELFFLYRITAGSDVPADRCIIPEHQSRALFTVRSDLDTGSGIKIMDLVEAAYPNCEFYVAPEGDEYSGTNLDRFVLYSSQEDVQKCVIPDEYRDLPASDRPNGSVLVPSTMSVGGVISNYPTGILTVDMDRTT